MPSGASSMKMDSNTIPNNLPESMTRTIKHYQQRSNWDCGVSCVLMCLNDEERDAIAKDVTEVCRQEEFGTSTWTIDLCYLIRHRSPKTTFYYTTTTIGVDPDYASEEFYNSVLKQDTNRVNQRFQNAVSQGVHIEEKRISTSDIISHVATRGVCIVLTNCHFLSCESCHYYSKNNIPSLNNNNPELNSKRLAMNFPGLKDLCPSNDASFQGHYVVVCGYDLPRQKLIYRNPSLCDRECIMSFQNFENARTSYGTDDDVLFVDMVVSESLQNNSSQKKERPIKSKLKLRSML